MPLKVNWLNRTLIDCKLWELSWWFSRAFERVPSCPIYFRLLLNPISRHSAAVLTKRFTRVPCQIASCLVLFKHPDLHYKPSYPILLCWNFIADVIQILNRKASVIILTLKSHLYGLFLKGPALKMAVNQMDDVIQRWVRKLKLSVIFCCSFLLHYVCWFVINYLRLYLYQVKHYALW